MIRVIVVGVVLLACVSLVGCGASERKAATNGKQNNKTQVTIDAFIAALNAAGIKAVDVTESSMSAEDFEDQLESSGAMDFAALKIGRARGGRLGIWSRAGTDLASPPGLTEMAKTDSTLAGASARNLLLVAQNDSNWERIVKVCESFGGRELIKPTLDASALDEMSCSVLSRVQTVRSQMMLYDVHNPSAAYDASTPLDTFWSALIKNNHLSSAPTNPLQGGSTKVGAKPVQGIGWVWAETPDDSYPYMQIYAVDEHGNWFDEKFHKTSSPEPWDWSSYVMQRARCKGTIGVVRQGIALFYVDELINTGNARHPTLTELQTPGKVFKGAIPKNPYSYDKRYAANRVAPATKADADQRRLIGSGAGWAYYDGSSGGGAVFYANTRTVGENEF